MYKEGPFHQKIRRKVEWRKKTVNLDMEHFTPPKAKRPANLWAPLPSNKFSTTATTTTTRAANPTMSSTCKTCKKWGPPCSFCYQSARHPSPIESDGSDVDWNRDKQKAKEEKKREQQDQEKNKEKNVPKGYCPTIPIYEPTFKQDSVLHSSPKEKLALDPDYYLQNYVLNDEEEEEDTSLLIANLVNPPENTLKEEKGEKNDGEKEEDKEEEERRKDSTKTQTDLGQEADEEEDSYSDSDFIY